MHSHKPTLLTRKNKKLFIFFLFLALTVILFRGVTAEALCIKDKKANLRKGPGKQYEKVWTVFKYMPLKRLEKKGNWLRVQDLEGDKYWVYKNITTKKYMCAVIKNDKTNLRQGPGTKFSEVEWSPIDKFFSVKVLKTKNSWVYIEDSEGDRAWVYRPLVWIQ